MPSERVSNAAVEPLIRQIKAICKHEEPFNISVVTAPSYISCFLSSKADQDIILVHRPMFNVENSLFDISTLPSQCERSQLEVTGNPLEHPFDDVSILQDKTVDACSPSCTVLPPGLPGHDATTICSVYNMKAPASCLPIWVVCDGTEKKNDGKVWLKCTQKTAGRFQTGYVVETGALEVEPDPKKLIAKHNMRLPNQNHPTVCKIQCQYRLTKDCSSEFLLKMLWPQPVFQPPTSSSSLVANLVMEYRIGSTEGPLKFVWEQLLLINNYMKCLGPQPSQSGFPSSEIVMAELEKRPVNSLKDILREPIRRAKIPTKERRDVIKFVTEISSPDNEELDALGKLWYLFLGECKNLQEVNALMEELRTELSDDRIGSHLNQEDELKIKDVIRRYIYYFVVSRLSFMEWISNILPHPPYVIDELMMSIKKLKRYRECQKIAYATSIRKDIEGMSPLKLLIEFGIVKLHKEFVSIFTGSQLSIDVPNLTRFGLLRSTEWLQAANNALKWLIQTFELLELLVRIQTALPDVENSNLHSIIAEHVAGSAACPIDIDWVINNPVNTFSCKLLPQLARRTVQENLPDEWLMTTTTTESPNYTVETRFFNGSTRRFIPAEQHNAENTMNISSISSANLTVGNLVDENVKFWSAEFCLIHH